MYTEILRRDCKLTASTDDKPCGENAITFYKRRKTLEDDDLLHTILYYLYTDHKMFGTELPRRTPAYPIQPIPASVLSSQPNHRIHYLTCILHFIYLACIQARIHATCFLFRTLERATHLFLFSAKLPICTPICD